MLGNTRASLSKSGGRSRLGQSKRKLISRMIEHLECRTLLAVTPIPFQHYTIDNNPGHLPVEKTLVDVDGDGKLDAIVGFSNANGPGGMVWYQFPTSGNPADKWNRYTIAAPGGNAYEDVLPYDVNGDGVKDLIASYNGNIVWFENPRGSGGDPRSGAWVRNTIGPGTGHELTLADLDGDGKIDIATNTSIYFQNSATSWTTVSSPQYNRAERGVAAFDSGSGLGAVDLVGVAKTAPYDMVWFSNPRDSGGNARTDVWTPHFIAPNYAPTDTGIGISFNTTDFNGDGRMDVISAYGEGNGSIPHAGGLIWWEAPVDRAVDPWIKHTIDATVDWVHKITLADMNKDGHLDVVFTEQEQSAQDRVGIYYNVDGSGDNWQLQVLSLISGHDQYVADINNDGTLDMLNAPHGFSTNYNPIEVYISQLNGVTSSVPTGWTDSDIGAVGLPGSASSSDGLNWTVSGGGADIFNDSDQFNFVYGTVGSSSTIIARPTSLTVTDPSSKAGAMFRTSTDPTSAFADLVLTPNNGALFQWRSVAGGTTSSVAVAGLKTLTWLKLVRSGNAFTAFYSSNGTTWTQIGVSQTITTPSLILGGLAVTARNNGMLNTAVFTGFSMNGGIPQGSGDLSAPIYLSDQPYTVTSNGWGQPEKDRSNGESGSSDGHTLTLNGQVYSKGLGVHASSDVRLNIAGGNYSEFRADIGVDDEVGSSGSVVFQVWLDSTMVFASGTMTGSSATQSIVIPLGTASTLRLVVTDSGNGNTSDHADWANARLIKFASTGDVNLDGRVDVADLQTMASHYNTSGNTWTTGDMNHDGWVNITDLTLLAQNWGYDVNGSVPALAPLLASMGLPNPIPVSPPAPVYLSDLPMTVNANGWGQPEKDRSNGETGAHDGHTITLNGKTYSKGIGVHARSELVFDLNAQFSQFLTDIGVDDEVGTNGSVNFQVYFDDVLVLDSGKMTGSSVTQSLNLNVSGVKKLKLVVTNGGDNNNFDHADWADARVFA